MFSTIMSTIAGKLTRVPDEQFTLTYAGPGLEGGRMDVRELAPALIALADAVREAHHLVNPGQPDPALHIEALREGSFSIDLILSEGGLLDQALDLLAGRESTAMVNLAAVVGGLFGVFKLLRKLARRLVRRQEALPDGSVRITFDDGTTLDLPAHAVQLSQNAQFRQAARHVVAPLEREGVDELRLDRRQQEPVRIREDDLPGFEIPMLPDEPLAEGERVVALRPVNIAFQEGNKWRVSDGETTFFATVADDTFIHKVLTGEETFARSDILRARLRTIQLRTANGDLKTEHTIIQVLSHERGPRQIPLPFENDPPAESED